MHEEICVIGDTLDGRASPQVVLDRAGAIFSSLIRAAQHMHRLDVGHCLQAASTRVVQCALGSAMSCCLVLAGKVQLRGPPSLRGSLCCLPRTRIPMFCGQPRSVCRRAALLLARLAGRGMPKSLGPLCQSWWRTAAPWLLPSSRYGALLLAACIATAAVVSLWAKSAPGPTRSSCSRCSHAPGVSLLQTRQVSVCLYGLPAAP